MNSIQDNWEEIKETLRKEHELSDVSYRTWIEPLEIYKVTDDTVMILVKLESSIEYIKNKFTVPFRVIIAEFSNKEYEIEFLHQSMINDMSDDSDTLNEDQKNLVGNYPDRTKPPEKYTFDTFVVGKNNQFAHAAALAVAENPGQMYNPLFLYGGVGLGKTHLMNAIAHFITEHNPDKRVLYVTSESFTNDLIESIRVGKSGNSNSMNKFREKYRNIDVLLIDDIQFIIGKESTQEEFFNTFNDLHSSGKAIIISSDKPPRDFDTLEERYRTRFGWGLTADINPPDFETRMAILHKKEAMDNLKKYNIGNDVYEYIASNITTNIRELEGALNNLVAMALLQNKDINVLLAQEAIKDKTTPKKRDVTPNYVLEIVSDHFHVPKDDLTGAKRNANICIPRQLVMYLSRKLTNATYESIGSMLNRDHTTVGNGERTITNLISTDAAFANTVDVLIKKICY